MRRRGFRSIDLGELGAAVDPVPAGLTRASRLYVANSGVFATGAEADAPRDPFSAKYENDHDAVMRNAYVGGDNGPVWDGVRLLWLMQPLAESVPLAALSLANGNFLTSRRSHVWTKAAMQALQATAEVFRFYSKDLEDYDYDARVHALRMELLFAAESFGHQYELYSAIFAGAPRSKIEERFEKAAAWVTGAWDQMEKYGSYIADAVIAAALAGGSVTAALVSSVAVIGTAAGPAFLAAVAAVMLYMLAQGIIDVFEGSHGSPSTTALEREEGAFFDEDAFERYVHKVHLAYKVALYRARTGKLVRSVPPAQTTILRKAQQPKASAGQKALAIGGGASAAGLVWWLLKTFSRRTR